ncbi:MAG: hypothetical protein GX621_03630 [Pirellulaceae bacterium]|nr:hypothetical protein [Pirellulaceae bacterium]
MKRIFALASILLVAASCRAADPDVLLNEDFSRVAAKLPRGWSADGDAWRVVDGQLRVEALDGETRIVAGKPDWENYEITVTATFDQVQNNSRWLAVVFRSEAAGKTPWSQFCLRLGCSQRNGAEFAVRTNDRRWTVRGAARLKEDCQLGVPRQLRVVVRGTDVEMFIDGRRVLENAYCVDRETGRVGLAASGCVARFDDFVVRRLPSSTRLSEMPLKPCQMIAHRGYSAVAPENTLASIDHAMRAGACAAECDVRISKDGHIVAMHDATVDRTTNGKGNVAELTLAELRELDAGSWKNQKFAGERVPTLDEILAKHKGSGCLAVIEIKVEGITQRVIQAIRDADMLDEAAIISFNAAVVREAREIEPRLPSAWLCGEQLKGTPSERADWLAGKAAEYKTDTLDLGYSMLSREVVAELKQRNIVIWAYTVNDPTVMEALMRWGVDGITTDRPDLAAAMRKKATAKIGMVGDKRPER